MNQLQASHATDLKNKGFTEKQVAQADDLCHQAAMMGVDWQALFVLIGKYGPTVMGMILEIMALFKPPTPVPGP